MVTTKHARALRLGALVIDPDPIGSQFIHNALVPKGYSVTGCTSLEEAKSQFKSHRIVVLRIPPDLGQLQQFSEWVKTQAQEKPPYILAYGRVAEVDHPLVKSGLYCHRAMPMPLSLESFENELEMVREWFASRRPAAENVREFDGALPGARTTFTTASSFEQNSLVEEGDSPFRAIAPGSNVGGMAKPVTARSVQGEQTRALIDNLPSSVAMFDRDMRYIMASKHWVEFFGQDEAKLRGRSHYEVYPDLHEHWKAIYEHCLRGNSETLEEELTRADGEKELLRIRVRPWSHQGSKRVEGLLVICESIAKDRASERKAKFEGNLGRAVISSVTAPAMVIDLAGRVAFANRAAKGLYDDSSLGVERRNVWDLKSDPAQAGKAQSEFLSAVGKLKAEGQFTFPKHEIEEVVAGQNDVPRTVAWSCTPHRNSMGLVEGIVRIGAELTGPAAKGEGSPAPVVVEPEAGPTAGVGVESTALALLRALPIPGWVLNGSGKCLELNQAWRDQVGWDEATPLDDWLGSVHPSDVGSFKSELIAAVQGDGEFASTYRIADVTGGGHSEFRIRVAVARDADGQLETILGTCHDVSLAKIAEEEQARADSNANEIQRLREQNSQLRADLEKFRTELEAKKLEQDQPSEAIDLEVEPEAGEEDGSLAVKAAAMTLLAKTGPARPAAGEERIAARLQSFAEQAPFGIAVVDPGGGLAWTNPSIDGLLGITVEEAGGLEAWLGKGCPDPVYREKVLEGWKGHSKGDGEPYSVSLTSASGALKELELRLVSDGDGATCAVFDVTESRSSESALRFAAAKFRALFEQGEASLLIDGLGDVLDANPAFEKFSGLSQSALLESSIDDLVDGLSSQRLLDLNGPAGEIQINLRGADGKLLPALVSARTIEEEGRLFFKALTFRDSEMKLRPMAEAMPAAASAEEPAPAAPEWQSVIPYLFDDTVLVIDDQGAISEIVSGETAILAPALDVEERIEGGDPVLFVEAFPEVAAEIARVIRDFESQTVEKILASEICFRSSAAPEADLRHCEVRLANSTAGDTVVRFRDVSDSYRVSGTEALQTFALDQASDAFIMTDARGRITGWNPAATTLFGYQKKDVLNCGLFTLFLPDSASEFAKTIRAAIAKNGRWEDTVTFYTSDGGSDDCDVLYLPIHPEDPESLALVGVQRTNKLPPSARPAGSGGALAPAISAPESDDDFLKVSELVLANAKKTVARAHHRMKNHLQIVSSLLSWQLKHVRDPDAAHALRSSLSRLNAIAIVYQHLSSERETEHVHFSRYCELLVQHLLGAFGTETAGVEVEVAESDLSIPVSRAVPVGIIVNELVSNALRHAFPQAVAGKIELGAKMNSDGESATLYVRDNGVGVPDTFHPKKSAREGLEIVHSLAKQIGGKVTFRGDRCTEFRVGFRVSQGK